MGTSAKAYSYLSDYIDGTSSKLVVQGKSCLTWFGGDMPPGGGSDAQAVTDLDAWVAAGALQN
ncbi:MAG: hypothetical protein ABSE49_12610 [Polyangiaceae bacterium]|jgi:hypothetical protein